MGIEPRKYDKIEAKDFKQSFVYIPREEYPRTPTEEELYEAGWTTKLVEEEGKLCIEKQREVIFCNQ